ncbi:TIGR03089 family protein [Actinocorallia populi]|uniref:TIGR03089 family protein n=1 Tax=Actinocorallia populi TaxID=2079200 RepID=UPI000D08E4C9|nr:TIGR03089 family protein [Actinocorallia populi]
MELTRAAAQKPLVTFYDDAIGERLEFSRRTFDNWVAKTSNLLLEGLDVRPGGTVVLDLPAHWQTAVLLFAAWHTGQRVVIGPRAELASAVDEGIWVTDTPENAPGWADEVLGLSLDAFGAPLADAPAWITDYAVEIRSYGDRSPSPVEAPPNTPVLNVMNVTFSRERLDGEVRESVARHGLTAGDRTLSTVAYTTSEALVAGLLAPLEAGGSVILCRNLDDDLILRRIETEHVTAIAGPEAPYAPVRRLL